ncbi:hypothetical protein BDV11DRAFT_199889 [Aspergillus similis]
MLSCISRHTNSASTALATLLSLSKLVNCLYCCLIVVVVKWDWLLSYTQHPPARR